MDLHYACIVLLLGVILLVLLIISDQLKDLIKLVRMIEGDMPTFDQVKHLKRNGG